MKKTIIIIDDHTDTSQSTIYKELINAALEIEKITAISIHTLLIGNNLDIPAAYFLQQGIDVTCIDLSTHLQTSHLDIALDRIKQFLNTKNPDIIITGHNTFGMSFLPQLAIHLNASCITGVKKITQKNNNLIFTRYIWNGKFESQVRVRKSHCVKVSVSKIV